MNWNWLLSDIISHDQGSRRSHNLQLNHSLNPTLSIRRPKPDAVNPDLPPGTVMETFESAPGGTDVFLHAHANIGLYPRPIGTSITLPEEASVGQQSPLMKPAWILVCVSRRYSSIARPKDSVILQDVYPAFPYSPPNSNVYRFTLPDASIVGGRIACRPTIQITVLTVGPGEQADGQHKGVVRSEIRVVSSADADVVISWVEQGLRPQANEKPNLTIVNLRRGRGRKSQVTCKDVGKLG